jgi:hypothetical protein
MSVRRLARLSGLSPSTISRRNRGLIALSREHEQLYLRALAAAEAHEAARRARRQCALLTFAYVVNALSSPP